MTVLTTPRPAAALPAASCPNVARSVRRWSLAVLRWTLALVLIVVLGELMTPVEARASVRSGAVSYGSNR